MGSYYSTQPHCATSSCECGLMILDSCVPKLKTYSFEFHPEILLGCFRNYPLLLAHVQYYRTVVFTPSMPLPPFYYL